MPKHTDPSANRNPSDLLMLIDDEKLHSFGLVHFYGYRKPWAVPDEDFPSFAYPRWHQVHDTISKGKLESPKFKSHLTEAGVAHYIDARILYSSTSSISEDSASSGSEDSEDSDGGKPDWAGAGKPERNPGRGEGSENGQGIFLRHRKHKLE